jgi:hypothetical protein
MEFRSISVPSFGICSSEEIGMSTFFCKITETNPSPIYGNFVKRNSVVSFALAPLQHRQTPLPAAYKRGKTKRDRGQNVILAIEVGGGTAVASNFKQSCEIGFYSTYSTTTLSIDIVGHW